MIVAPRTSGRRDLGCHKLEGESRKRICRHLKQEWCPVTLAFTFEGNRYAWSIRITAGAIAGTPTFLFHSCISRRPSHCTLSRLRPCLQQRVNGRLYAGNRLFRRYAGSLGWFVPCIELGEKYDAPRIRRTRVHPFRGLPSRVVSSVQQYPRVWLLGDPHRSP